MLEMHRIFSESWRLMIGNGEHLSNSAMKLLATKIENAKFEKTNQGLLACKQNHDVLRQQEIANQETLLQMFKSECRAQVEYPIATWTWNKKMNEMSFEANPNQLTAGIGESLSMLNAVIKCKIKLSDSDKISKMSCENLGQGLSRTTHIKMSQFEYDINAENILVVEADRYENLFQKVGCDAKDSCLKMKVPALGMIKIVENRKMAKLVVLPTVLPAIMPKKNIETPSSIVQANQDPINEGTVEVRAEETAKKENSHVESQTVETQIAESNSQNNTQNNQDQIVEGNGLANAGQENSELQLAGYKPEDLQSPGISGTPGLRVNPVFLSEGQHPGLHR
jgi:hypothetical protein